MIIQKPQMIIQTPNDNSKNLIFVLRTSKYSFVTEQCGLSELNALTDAGLCVA